MWTADGWKGEGRRMENEGESRDVLDRSGSEGELIRELPERGE